jgi:hypothetical protein
MTDEPITVFSCPPGNQATCEHVWDGPEKIFFRECRDCDGIGVISGDGEEVICEKCEGKGDYECGSSATCSKCGMDAMTWSLWNGP